jgi:hypothetical protein
MPIPELYDDPGIVIDVNPDGMFQAVTGPMTAHGKEVADCINEIVKIWNGLKLGWMGRTADEVRDFSERWTASITQLFGTPDDPKSGALSVIGNAVASAAGNYGQAEDIVMKTFDKVTEALGNESGSWSGSRSVTDAPITEQN